MLDIIIFCLLIAIIVSIFTGFRRNFKLNEASHKEEMEECLAHIKTLRKENMRSMLSAAREYAKVLRRARAWKRAAKKWYVIAKEKNNEHRS